MLFWIAISLLTAVVALALLMPLFRGATQARERAAGEVAVYRDQIAELQRDCREGLISPEEAEYARAEIARRLLAAAREDGPAESGFGKRSLAQLFVILAVPAIGLGVYLNVGSPGTPAAPLAARLENPGNNVELLVAKAERHLAQNPGDGAGWDVLAPIYFRMGRVDDSEMAYRNALRLNGPDAARLNGLAETLMAQADGIVTADARSAFEEAQRLSPGEPRSRYYLALALEQAGKAAEAKAAFEALAKDSPPDAPWQGLVAQHVARNGGGPTIAAAQNPNAPGHPTAADVEAAETMSSGDRTEMIRGMVSGLDAKLRQDPKNFEGWMRLIRSYAVLKDEERALDALKTGLRTFPAEGQEGAQLVALARDLGLPVEEALK